MKELAKHTRAPKSKETPKAKLGVIDAEQDQYMKEAEKKKCRRIESGRIPFSPESLMWIRRAQVYRSLLIFHAKEVQDLGNLKRAAQRCGIKDLTKLSLQEIRARLNLQRQIQLL